MMWLFFLLISLTAVTYVVSVTPSPADRYAKTQVVRVPAGNSTQVADIDNIISRLGLDAWASASSTNPFFDIVLPLTHAAQFSSEILQLGVPVTVMHADLGESILKESLVSASESVPFEARALIDETWFNAYHSYTDHMSYIDELAAMFPENAKTFAIGTSAEGRQITGINIFGSSGSGTKPAVIFFGTMHGREWITTMVTEYLGYNLLSGTEGQGYLEEFDFYIIPIVNPDGFVYSQTTDRLWCKNRSSAPLNSTCVGRDLNRNFPYKWGIASAFGAPREPCSDFYEGLAEGDTPEAAAMANFLTSKGISATGAKLFINFNSYGNLFLSPYGWTETEVPVTNAQIESVAIGFAEAVRAVHGTNTVSGTIASIDHVAGGTTVDYAFEIAKIPYSYAHILRDSGLYGYILPVDQIIPNGQETYTGVKYLLDTLYEQASK